MPQLDRPQADRAQLDKMTRIDDVSEVVDASHRRSVLVFKHSLTCGVSSTAFRELQSFLVEAPEDLDVRLIEVQNARDVSNALAETTGVRHQSPQALLLRDGEVVWHASHWKIDAGTLSRAVAG